MTTFTYSPFMRSLTVPAVSAKVVPSVLVTLAAWREQRRIAREDRELWAMAQLDPRLMTDLVCAQRRAD